MKLIALTALAYISGIIPTVTIKTKGGAVRINEEDFDPKTMEMYEPADAEPEPEPVVEPEKPKQLLVMKSGRKFFIRDDMGQEVTGEGIDADGYSTEAAAIEALSALSA